MNPALFDGLCGNALVTTLLALAAAILRRRGARPEVVHALCLIALAKLLTPAGFTLPLLPAEPSDPVPAVPLLAALPVSGAGIAPPPARLHLADVLLAVWGLGAAVVLGAALRRIARLRRLIDAGRPADASLAAEVEALAQRIGVRRAPPAVLVAAAVSPALVRHRGRATILLPERLVRSLPAPRRRSVLLHELAHLKRRDDLVRYVELAVTVAFWWLPLTWWIRSVLHAAEEACCDAWVVRVSSDDPRAYADALVDTVAFLAGAPVASPLASGAGRVESLKQRLESIMRTDTRSPLSRSGRLALAAVAALTLPVLPTRAQEEREASNARLEEALRRVEALEVELRAVAEAMRQEAGSTSGTVRRATAPEAGRAAARAGVAPKAGEAVKVLEIAPEAGEAVKVLEIAPDATAVVVRPSTRGGTARVVAPRGSYRAKVEPGGKYITHVDAEEVADGEARGIYVLRSSEGVSKVVQGPEAAAKRIQRVLGADGKPLRITSKPLKISAGALGLGTSEYEAEEAETDDVSATQDVEALRAEVERLKAQLEELTKQLEGTRRASSNDRFLR